MSRPRGARNKQLPKNARKLLSEARDYMTPLVEAILEAEGAGIDCSDAKEWAAICHAGIQTRAQKYFPDLAYPEGEQPG